MPFAIAGAAVLAGGASIYSGIQAGKATKANAKAMVDAARLNLKFATKSADFDIFASQLKQREVHRQAARAIGAQKTAYASQNVDLSSETVSQLREEAVVEANREANEIEMDALVTAWGKKTQAMVDLENAKNGQQAARIEAQGQIVAGVANGLGHLASAASYT